MNNIYNTFAIALAEQTGIDTDSATKVVNWLISEGVLDAPVIHDEFVSEGTAD